PQVIHKSDVGGVKVNLRSEDDVRRAYREIVDNVRRRVPDARIEGILVQEFAPPGAELIIGLIRDPQFGPTVMFGLGGIFVEVFRDVSFRVAPLSEQDAETMIKEIKAYKLLTGFRGAEPVDINAIKDALIKVGRIGVENEEIAEMDLNPVIAYPKGIKVVDARIFLGVTEDFTFDDVEGRLVEIEVSTGRRGEKRRISYDSVKACKDIYIVEI
ncbi:MAG: acetate--CoA ligase family protein, partial [Candidatus Korarchaeum sp.]